MANNSSEESAGNAGRMLIFIVLLSVSVVIIYKNFAGKGSNFTKVPKELQINYKPSNFHVDIDEDDALVILSNPYRYKRDFDQLVYDINMSILNHVAERMGLEPEIKNKLESEYKKHHPYLKKLYFEDFVALKDTTSVIYQTWYDNESTNAVEVFDEIASKYTCFFVNQIITTLVKTEGGSIYAKGDNVDTPCGIALTEALRPLVQRMDQKAAVEDFGRSKGLLQEKVEKVVAELATMEVRDKKGISKNLQTKVWGVNVSSSDVEITAISILKVGFKLNKYFSIDLNSKAGVVTVTLPEPVILSHEVYPKIEKLDIGWMREVEDINLNDAMNVLREEFRRDALESDIRAKSKKQAVELMNTMFMPLIKSMSSKYKLKVKFKASKKDNYEVDEKTPDSKLKN
ncbi:MAG TPA: DUF4230 domain-containing protein [Saprospiraceae bacterium]|nr:DUF4230 domain-containing protein [Saprospiraceae bacterium]